MPDLDDLDFRRDRDEEREWSAADHQPGEVAAQLAREEVIRKAAENLWAGSKERFPGSMTTEGALWIARELASAGLLVTPQHDAEKLRKALDKIAYHLAMPGVLWWGDAGVTVRDPDVEFDRGVQLVDWLRVSGGGLNVEPEPEDES
jgi:hypothetical protein